MKKIFIEIGHPAHVHHFKNMYWELEKRGWQGLFITKDKDCAINLLKSYKLPFKILGKTQDKIVNKILTLPYFALKMYKLAKIYKPDLFVSRGSPISGWSSFLLRKPHITLSDTENVKLYDSIAKPFIDVILTSSSYKRNHGGKQIRYPGYHELAYLHPNVFTPDERVLAILGMKKGEKYAIVRFVAWEASHDIGHSGISYENKIKLVKTLSRHLRVFISSEKELPEELKNYQIKIPPEQMHNALAYAHMYIGEGATMAEECSILGTPAIHVNPLTGGLIEELEQYEILYYFNNSLDDQYKAINLASQIAQNNNIKREIILKRDKMLNDKIDVTKFLIWFINCYPLSTKIVKAHNFNYDKFK